MKPERWQKVQELFDRALLLPEADRSTFITVETDGDEDLRHHLESLLEADAAGQGFFEGALEEGLDLFQGAQQPSETPQAFGKYQVLGEIGAGGFGKVYRGRDPQLEREVAIKTCSANDIDLRRRFFREAKISAGLQHPKIVTVHDFGEAEGLPFLVQELLDGEDLDRLIERGEEISLARKVEFLLQISRGLAYAHEEGVLHRDVKPANIRVLGDGGIKILDFGIACLLNGEHRLTQERVTVGTVSYIAPEQLKAGGLDERSDIFSFGVLAYELLVFQRPFVGGAFAEIAHQILHKEPEPLRKVDPSIPAAVASCVHRCLEKDPAGRYSSFREVVAHLEGISGSGFADPPAASPPRRRGALALAAAFLAVLLVLGISWSLRPDPRARLSPASGEEVFEAAPQPAAAEAVSEEARAGDSEKTGGEALGEAPGVGASSLATSPAIPEGAGDRELATSRGTRDRRRPEGLGPSGAPDPVQAEGGALARRGASGPASSAGSSALPSAPVPGPEAPSPGADSEEPAPGEAGRVLRDPLGDTGQDSSAAQLALEASRPKTGGPADKGRAPEPRTTEAKAPKATPPSKPVLQSRPDARYPILARRRQLEADVTVGVLVNSQGRVQRTLILGSTDPGVGFEQAAEEAARGALFEPAREGGEAIQDWAELLFEFRLP